MINRVGLLLAAACVAGLTSVAWSETVLNVSVQSSEGGSTISVSPGGTVNYQVIGDLSDDPSEGLALVLFNLSLDGGSCTGKECDLTQADTPTGEPSPKNPMAAFVIPDGITNPAGFGCTVIDGDLIQCCGGQNTIKNDVGNAPFPVGTVITGVAQDPVVLLTGSLTAPTTLATYTLNLSGLAASVIREGETGDDPFWATELAGVGEITNLTIEVIEKTAECGNGELEGSEECDDGNTDDGDCCSSTCTADSDGTECDDGSDCTSGDQCTGGACAGDYEAQAFADICLQYCPPSCPQPNIDDILCILDDFADGAGVDGCACNGFRMTTDLHPCPEDGGGDGIMGIDDILKMLDAFAGLSPCADPCP